MRDGDVMQVDTPSGLYDNPANVFVATFIGTPKMNLLKGELVAGSGQPALRLLGADVALADVALHPAQARILGTTCSAGATMRVGLRPADLRPPEGVEGAEHTGRVRGVVDLVEHVGSEVFAAICVDDDQLVVGRYPRNIVPSVGDIVELSFDSRDLYFFDADTSERLIDRQQLLQGLETFQQEVAMRPQSTGPISI
jgi:multiple sugar transport system ATP-binding protein